MDISPINQTSFGRFGYYGKQGVVLDEVFPNYSRNLKDSDVVYISDSNGVKHPQSAGNIRTLAIQEQYPGYRYMFKDSDVVTKEKIGDEIVLRTAGDIRKEFAQEEAKTEHDRRYPTGKIDYII